MTKFFITGGSGFIGSEVVDELLSHGHEVLALARSDNSAKKLIEKGVQVLRGSIEDLDVLKKGANETDGTIHLAYDHNLSNFAKSGHLIDYEATKTIVDTLEGTNKVFIYTSGLGGLPTPIGIQSNETDRPNLEKVPKEIKQRMETEHFVLDSYTKNIRSIVIRLSPIVHGTNDHGFTSYLSQGAKKNGVALYANEGKSTWPSIHKKDAAVLYRLAAEKGQPGKAYHGASESGIETKLIAETIAKKIGVETKSTNINELSDKLGFIGGFFAVNINSSSELTRKELGWEPKELGLIEDIEKNYTL
ncbi:UDP-glucose 4-epimerase [Wickerhamomyces ciferrii]|uniref:UDP-glucose 4-epimerase n=1 Tax=Wickerhamomyces ciferrii (strain ATCC 14091 / BCRC 22168 / CBS 111 / JCM 3599 / NBRC 0793 / NRRL Y-1031 F-60-10) TaxID=1206466 RepID=K0KXD4_WICCF|nr:UDP-glucose 4-epimerase [Wickerhamomyces ciferrii]CCH45733.1 UDP-glucose 4-epimerase [Wickerhamomyces ciferrii]